MPNKGLHDWGQLNPWASFSTQTVIYLFTILCTFVTCSALWNWFNSKGMKQNLRKRLACLLLSALLLIGFGIQDSLLPIVTKQSTELTHNDMSITLSDPKALTMEQGLAQELDSNSAVQNWSAVYTKSTTIYNAEGESASVSIVAAAKDSDLTRYVTFRTRKGHKAISFDSGSAILTEKTAENLGLHTGDTFWVENAEGSRV